MDAAGLAMQLLKAKEAAEAAGRAKNELLANLSHNVRTAVSNILGMTDGVLATELTPEQRADLSLVKDSAESLLRIMDDAIEWLKIEER
jgi:signal transduction histidine kinase